MYTHIPPVRSDYHSTIIYLDTLPDIIPLDNYIYISHSECYLSLEKYKTSKTYGKIIIDLPPLLVNEIKRSLELLPRTYLFISEFTGKPFDLPNSFNIWANRTLKKILNNSKFTLTMFRHIYISRDDLHLETLSGLQQDEIAKLMGHSIEQQRKYLWHTWLRYPISNN
jgi:integrase